MDPSGEYGLASILILLGSGRHEITAHKKAEVDKDPHLKLEKKRHHQLGS